MVLETRDELVAAKQQRDILARTSLERCALKRTLERNGDPVAIGGRFRLGDERAILFGNCLQRLIDFGVGYEDAMASLGLLARLVTPRP